MPNVAESFLRGAARADAEHAAAQDTEERKLRQAVLKHQLSREKLQDLMTEYATKFEASKNRAALTSGQPELSYQPSDIQGGYPLDRVPNTQGLDLHSKPLQLTGVPTPAFPELGIPAGSIQRQTLEALSAQRMREEINKSLSTAHVLHEGDSLHIPIIDQQGGGAVATGSPERRSFQTLQRMYQAPGMAQPQEATISFEPRTGKMFIGDPTPQNEIDPAKVTRIPPQGLFNTPEAAADIKDNAQQLVDGNMLPATLSKRGPYNQILAEANRLSREQTGKAYNPIKAQLDYEGAKRFVGSMNSQQMVRFRGLAGSVVNTIDEVRRLGDELKQGGIQKWNQLKRSTIQQVYGNTPQSELAAQYLGAVNTLKEEFANLANGGYAPTDPAWKLANQQINENFGAQDLAASISEVRRLIGYRVQAFDEQRPSLPGISLAAPPAPVAAPAPTRIYYDANGNPVKR